MRCCLNVQVMIADHSSFAEACERVRRSANARCVGRTNEKCGLALSDTKNGSFLLLSAADIGKFAYLHTLVDRGMASICSVIVHLHLNRLSAPSRSAAPGAAARGGAYAANASKIAAKLSFTSNGASYATSELMSQRSSSVLTASSCAVSFFSSTRMRFRS